MASKKGHISEGIGTRAAPKAGGLEKRSNFGRYRNAGGSEIRGLMGSSTDIVFRTSPRSLPATTIPVARP